MNQPHQARSRSRLWLLLPGIAAALTAALIVLYALGGFVLAPWIAARELPRLIEERLDHRARIGEISFNPFTLRLHAREFALETKDGRPVLGFADAVVGLAWHSLLRRAWVLEEARLVDPKVHVAIAKDGRLNLSALAPGAGQAGSPPRFVIDRMSVTNGVIDFEDHRHGYRNRVEHLVLELASLSTLDPESGSYEFSGQTPGGASLRWKGGLALAPLAATGTLAIGNAALAELRPYADEATSVRVVAGRADLELPFHYSHAEARPRFSVKEAKVHVRDLALAGVGEQALLTKLGAVNLDGIDFDWSTQHVSIKSLRAGESTLSGIKDKVLLATAGPATLHGAEFALASGHGKARELAIAGVTLAAGDDNKPLAQLRQLALEGITLDLRAQHVSAKSLRIPELALAAKRNANGEIDALRLFAGRGGAAVRGVKANQWQASVDRMEIGTASARYADYTAKTPLALTLDGLSGSFALEAALADEGVRVRLDSGNFTAAELSAVPAGTGAQPRIKFAELSLDGARYDGSANTVEVGTVRAGSFGMDTVLDGGRLSLLDLIPAANAKSDQPLAVRAKTVDLGGGSINFTDRGRGLALALERVALKLDDASSDASKPLAFDLSAEVKSGGRIALSGRGVPAQGTVEAKLEASNVALAPAQSVLAQFANVKFASGDVSLAGMLRAGAKDAKLAYSGRASIANLALEDTAGLQLFGWKSLATDALKMTLSPDRIDIDELRLTAPAGRFAIAKDGTSNLSRAFAKTQGAGGETKGPAGETSATAPDGAPEVKAGEAKTGVAGTFAVAVRRVRVDQGALDFSDESLSPNFVAKIYDLAGTANGLSSNREARSQFAFEGRVDEFGYANLSGAVNPFAPRNRSTFRVQLRNIDLITVTPYAMRFAGFRIASGRLGLDLNYRVRNNLIEGDNKITLEQFTLGEHVDSPDALKLPFELAISLLKDPEGRISLEVPVKCNLDDPQFSLAPLIWEAVGHFIGNIVAAPFRALAHLFGGGTGEDLGTIVFDPGKAKLLPPEREKLGRVAEALAKRPELKLLVPAQYDSEADARVMKRAEFGREINRRAGFAVAEDDDPGPVNIEDQATRRALRAMFTERFSKAELDRLRAEADAKALAAGTPAPSLTTRLRNFASGEPHLVDTREFHQTLLRRLRETQTLAPNALAELAQQRALAIESALKAAGADQSRIARTTLAPTANAEAKQITLHLSLAAS